jgi:hypothetical protein
VAVVGREIPNDDGARGLGEDGLASAEAARGYQVAAAQGALAL